MINDRFQIAHFTRDLLMLVAWAGYFRKDLIMNEDRKIVRTYSAGVFFGTVENRNGQNVIMRNARRLWRWEGASSLSELAVKGVSRIDGCKFPMAVDRIELLQCIEILDVTNAAATIIDEVPIWTSH